MTKKPGPNDRKKVSSSEDGRECATGCWSKTPNKTNDRVMIEKYIADKNNFNAHYS